MATWSEIRTEIEAEYDLAEETFISQTELLYYANSAIERIEAAIIAECPGYFKTVPFQISLLADVADYSMPSDIYANKMNLIYYESGSTKYELPEIKDLRQIMDIQSGERFRYLIVNSTASGTKIRFYPRPTQNESSVVNIFYTRNIKRFSADSDELDVPEAKIYVKEFVKEKAANKERMLPDAPDSQNLINIKNDIIGSLKTMIVDENNTVPMDMEYYDSFVGECGGY